MRRVSKLRVDNLQNGRRQSRHGRELHLDRILLGPLDERRDVGRRLAGSDGLLLLLVLRFALTPTILHELLGLLLRVAALALQGLELLLLLLPGLLLLVPLLPFEGLKRVVVAPVVVERPLLRDVQRLVTHRIQEVLVVRHDQYGMLVFLQVIIQPNDGVQVQVIRRLVEHQQNRLHEERPRQGDAHAPAAGKQLRGPHLHLRREAQPEQDPPRLRVGRGRADGLEFLADDPQSVRRLGLGGARERLELFR